MQISSGKRPTVKTDEKSEDTPIPIIGASKVMGWTNVALIDESILTTGRVGTHGVIQRFNKPVWVSDNSFILKSNFEETVYQILATQIDFKGLNHGSTQPLITQTDLKKYEIVLPTNSDIEKFETFASKLNQKQVAIELENENLVILRDSLLPKLLSGEIELN
jgi:type I restriction enzyme S subunit